MQGAAAAAAHLTAPPPLPPVLPRTACTACPVPPVPQAALNGYQLDKAHKFAATLFDECERLAKVPESYTAPEPRAYAPGENLLVGGRASGAGGYDMGWGWEDWVAGEAGFLVDRWVWCRHIWAKVAAAVGLLGGAATNAAAAAAAVILCCCVRGT
jgi:hypothetical protein